MAFVLILIGLVLVVSAYQGTQSQLGADLKQDIPPFAVWALAIAAVGGLGFIPGMKVISRYLIALVLVVLVLRNYVNITNGFKTAVATSAPAQATVDPATQFADTGTVTAPNALSSTAALTPAGVVQGGAQKVAMSLLDPATYLALVSGAA